MRALMGIVNVTPDSFSDGGMYAEATKAIEHAEQLFLDGATYVDIGGESTRPDATPLTADNEWRRVEAVLADLIPRYPGQISFDTYHPENVIRAGEFGSYIVNDVTGMTNTAMLKAVGAVRHKVPIKVIASHLPKYISIQRAHETKPVRNISEIALDLKSAVAELSLHGIEREDIWLDPGIGFGKSPELNMEALEIGYFLPEYLVLVGYSRKSFLGEHRKELPANLAAGRRALAADAQVLRVHDVAGHMPLIEEFNERGNSIH